MPTWNIPALLFAVALSLGMAIVGGLLTGNQLTQWFATLHKPRLQLPLWGFVCVGLYGYLVDIIIAYRLLTVVPGQTARIIALTALQRAVEYRLVPLAQHLCSFPWHPGLFNSAHLPPGHARACGFRFGLVGFCICTLGDWLRYSLGLSTLATESSLSTSSQLNSIAVKTRRRVP